MFNFSDMQSGEKRYLASFLKDGKLFEVEGSISDLFENGVPESVILKSVAASFLEKVKALHASVLKQNSGSTGAEERDTWPIQVAASSAFISGKADETQKALLDDLLVGDETKTSLSKIILGKDAAVKLLIGKCGGWRRRTEYAISEADTVEGLQVLMTKAETELKAVIQGFQEAMTDAQSGES